MINLYYAKKDLQYTEVGSKSYPDVNILFDLAEGLHFKPGSSREIHREYHFGKATEVD